MSTFRRLAMLERRGIPEPFRMSIATRHPGMLSGTNGFLAGVAVLIVIVGLAWQIMAVSDGLRWRFAAEAAAREGALLYAPAGALSPLGVIASFIALFMLALWLLFLSGVRVRPHPAPNLAASLLRAEGRGGGMGQLAWFHRGAIRAARGSVPRGGENADAFLAAVGRWQARVIGFVAIPLTLFSAGAILLGMSSHWHASAAGLVSHHLWQTQSYSWPGVTQVLTGCFTSEGQNRLVFDVEVGGETYRLSSESDGAGREIPSPERFNRLETIRAAVEQAGVPIRRWQWQDTQAEDPGCLAHWATVAGENGAERVQRLLAVHEVSAPVR